MRVCGPVTLRLGGVSVLLVAERQADKGLAGGGGQELDIRVGGLWTVSRCSEVLISQHSRKILEER